MVIPSLIRKAFDNDVLSVWGDGSAIRDFIHARDVARGMLHMVDNQVTEPVNLGSGDPISIKAIAETIVGKMPKDINIEWDTTKPSGDARRLFDMTRAFGHGFAPEVSIEQGIEETILWYADNKEWVDQRYNVFKQS
jgi:GDP-L-fucose synthase